MYSIISIDEKLLIKVGDFIIGEVFEYEEGVWCAVVDNKNNKYISMKYYENNLVDAVEGLLKQMIYNSSFINLK